jgi:hypothetical protein
MKRAMIAGVVVGLGLLLGVIIIGRFGLSVPMFIAAAACVAASMWAARQIAPPHRVDRVDYELNLLARLDNPNPEVHRRAEMERDLHHWQRSH